MTDRARQPDRCVVVGGSTRTAAIDGISAAGATATQRRETPAADLEILVFGRPTPDRTVPVSPTGTPTPAVVTRAVAVETGLSVLAVDAGLATDTLAPTLDVGAEPGADIRAETAVPDAETYWERAAAIGRSLPVESILLGETIPGGTTTALGVLAALGERRAVSSSLPDNPTTIKAETVETGLAASGLPPGDAAGDPRRALRYMGDPVLATVAGLARGALATGVDVTLAGGTQLAAAAALLRHDGVAAPLRLATTSYVADDETAAMADLAADLDLSLVVTDPGFDRLGHDGLAAYAEGVAKEGVAMGGALAVARDAEPGLSAIRARTRSLTTSLTDAMEADPA